jgi:hypothetical protein
LEYVMAEPGSRKRSKKDPEPPETGWTDRVPTSPEPARSEPARSEPAEPEPIEREQAEREQAEQEPAGDERTRQEVLATPADLHADYVRQRVDSDEGPTPEAYARARAQWRRLPGAVSASPADSGEPPPPADDGSPADDRSPGE